VLVSSRDVVIAYIGATDGFAHLYEEDRLVQFLVDLDTRARDVRGRATEHAEKRAARMDKILTAASRRGLGTQTAVRLAANIDRDAHAMKRIARHNTVLISQPEAWT